MQNQSNSTVAYLLIISSLAIAIYFIFSGKLAPPGYELAIDGYVISRTLMMIFALYLASKLGFYMLNKKD